MGENMLGNAGGAGWGVEVGETPPGLVGSAGMCKRERVCGRVGVAGSKVRGIAQERNNTIEPRSKGHRSNASRRGHHNYN